MKIIKSHLVCRTLLLLPVLCLYSNPLHSQNKTSGFTASAYSEIALGDIKPNGWLQDQLEIMANNSTGHMDEIYERIKNDNGWLGGKGDDWEQTPYWLDGAVPLAWQLDDKVLQKKVMKYINWSLDHQRPSGYFGPVTDWERETGKTVSRENCEEGEDWWPKMIMLKVIQQYYSATKDARVIPFMENYFGYQNATLDHCPIGKWTQWSASRGIENVKMVQWLYTQNGDKSLLDLAEKIKTQSFAWSDWLGNRDWVINAAVHPDGDNWMHRHGVNVGMALKAPAENFKRTGDSTYLSDLKTGYTDIMNLHGLPNGIFSADEDLHGNSPTHGTELCAIVETMYSLEDIIAITGDPFYMDALERATFNALPPQTTDDYQEKQYFQIANQIEIQRGVYGFTLPFDRKMNNVFGAKSGYTCCYVNMHQGWTKFTQHLWYGTPEKGLAALEYSPNTLTTQVGASHQIVTIREDTSYPFDETIRFVISTKKPVNFEFKLRIPSWCSNPLLKINDVDTKIDSTQQIITLDRSWNDGDEVVLVLPMEIRISSWAENSKAVERGPLVYGLKIDQKWGEGNDEKEGKYLTVEAQSPWNYGLLQRIVQDPQDSSQVEKIGVKDDFIWNLENVPIAIKMKAKKIPDWKAVNGLAHLPVSGRDGIYKGEIDQTEQTITLVPVGFTKLRIMAFPVVK